MNLASKLVFIPLIFSSLVANATEWTVVNDASELSFISIKKQSVGEVHRFKQIEGSLNNDGQFDLTIDLSSVDTGVSIRDTRMKDLLFKISQYPMATLKAQVDAEKLKSLAIDESVKSAIDAELNLHGKIQPITLNVLVTKLSATRLLVTATQPVILNVSDYALVEGVEKLREIAGLPSISHAVPVSFYLTLNAKN